MKLIDYVKDKILEIMITVLGFILILFLLIFLNAHILLVISLPIIYMAVLILIFINNYIKRKTFYKNMNNKLQELDKKYLITEIINNSSFIDANIFLNYLYDIDKCYMEEINKYKISNQEFREYIELWCHEIKTPIATSNMIIDNNKSVVTNEIKEEINKIDAFIEQVLFYARSGNVEKDYIISKINLKSVIEDIIKKNKKTLISNKIKISINGELYVESDIKWLDFIINQILINSIKYKKDNNSEIKIEMVQNKNNVILSITDNGIGIKPDEIDRVFDKGFTGTNGRINKKSTGIGLYLVKKMCDKLGHNITIESVENKYTNVIIVFPLSNLTKM